MSALHIHELSDRELTSRLGEFVRREHRLTLNVLVHLNEVERRRLHRRLGYTSLFDYCTSSLKYSASAAGRRIQVARCVRRFPEVLDLLRERTVSLSTVALVASILSDANKAQLLLAIQGRSQREVEAIASRYRPPLRLRDRVKPVRVVVENVEVERPMAAGADTASRPDDHAKKPPLQPPALPAPVSARSIKTEHKHMIQFVAGEALMKKLTELKALLSNCPGDLTLEQVFETAVNDCLERRCPRRRQLRRQKRAQKIAQKQSTTPAKSSAETGAHESRKITPAAGVIPPSTADSPGDHRNLPVGAVPDDDRRACAPRLEVRQRETRKRYVTPATRDLVFTRDRGRCTYVAPSGRRCEATHRLHLDHIVPYARGGSSDVANLRLLCASHNMTEAERLLGTAVMERFE